MMERELIDMLIESWRAMAVEHEQLERQRQGQGLTASSLYHGGRASAFRDAANELERWAVGVAGAGSK